ncbi:MAG TPA: hypothetical protein VFC13_11110 [Actinomycetes bacterium]|nr:hypothetical protein [Actinomycetes bacterium]
MAYRVLAVSSFAAELRDAPGELRGYVSAVVAVLRVDPTMASVAFSVVEEGDDERTAIFANGRGFLTYWAPRGRGMVVLLRLVWA